eukprot:scaffold80917_cov63-Phaeocystis_antarctica.AAC.2
MKLTLSLRVASSPCSRPPLCFISADELADMVDVATLSEYAYLHEVPSPSPSGGPPPGSFTA